LGQLPRRLTGESSNSAAMKFIVLLFSFSAVQAATMQNKEEPKSPITKVVELLEELQAGMERDQKSDQAIYDKFACWCEETTGKYAEFIKKSQKNVERLGTLILEKKGEVAVLSAEIEKLNKEIAENKESQEKATSIRSKENEAFMAEKIELEQAIAALEKAVTVLAGAGTGKKTGLLQSGTSDYDRIKIVAGLKYSLQNVPARVAMTTKQLVALEKFSNVEEEEPSAPDTAAASYSPASATIQGILKDMYDTMSADLEKQTHTEASKQRAFEDLIAELKESLRNMESELRKKEAKKAEASMILADASQELDDTTAQLKSDIEFFDLTTKNCKRKAEEWSDRNQGYEDEIEGIKKALEILTSDDAKELFGKAIKPGKETGFLQLSLTRNLDTSAPKRNAYAALKNAASQSKSLRLATLAAGLRLGSTGHFDKVIEKIDEMIETLKKEDKEDIEQRDECKENYHELAQSKAEIEWLIKKNEAAIVKIEGTIEKITESIEDTEKAISDTKKELEDMEKERTEENEAFIQAKEDDQAAIKLLEQAIEALSGYYKNNKIEMGPVQGSAKGLLQEPEFDKGDQAPDAEFKKKGHRKNQSKGIISIMTMIKEDLEDEIKAGIKSEVEAQAAYEKQVDAANALIEDLKAKKTNLEQDLAKQEEAKLEQETDMKDNKADLKTNGDEKESITEDCDWIIENFEERVKKRGIEKEGLVKAKEFLGGASPGGFLQH
jgi:hypothetical protein